MIAYFPEIYEDELIYSVLSRYYVHSGYLHYRNVEQDLFCSKQGRVEKEFVKWLKPEIVELLTKNMTFEELLEKHTMYPFYGRFINSNRRNMAFEALMSMEGDFSKLFCVPNLRKGEQRYMRYCPLCVAGDRERYGETYWHRLHQLRNVNICTVHECYLVNSSVPLDSRESVNLVSAEEIISSGDELQKNIKCLSFPLELELSCYVVKVFLQPLNRNNTTAIKDFLHSRMAGTPYLSLRGEHKYFHKLWEDMKSFYHGVTMMDFIIDRYIQSLLMGKRLVFSEICMVAMFLGISAEELSVMKAPSKTPEQQFDEKVMMLLDLGMSRRAVAREMGVPSSLVAVSIELAKKESRERKHTTGIRNSINDWVELDRNTLPLVKKAIREMHGDGENRPQKVSIYAVSKKINIASQRLIKMKQCKMEIEQNIESIEQYRARKVIWAVNALKKGNKPLKYWRISHITKLEKAELESCLPYLKEMSPDLYEMVLTLL